MVDLSGITERCEPGKMSVGGRGSSMEIRYVLTCNKSNWFETECGPPLKVPDLISTDMEIM